MRSTGYTVWSWKTGLCEEKQIQNYGYALLAGRADLNPCTRKRGPKSLKKARGAANLQSRFLAPANEIRMRSRGTVTRERKKNWKKVTSHHCLDEVNSVPRGILPLTLLELGLLPLLRRNNKREANSKHKLNWPLRSHGSLIQSSFCTVLVSFDAFRYSSRMFSWLDCFLADGH